MALETITFFVESRFSLYPGYLLKVGSIQFSLSGSTRTRPFNLPDTDMAVKHFSLHKINQTIAVGYKTVHWTNLLNVFVPLSRIVESLKSPVFSVFFFLSLLRFS